MPRQDRPGDNFVGAPFERDNCVPAAVDSAPTVARRALPRDAVIAHVHTDSSLSARKETIASHSLV
jgi:hypothetical protein